MARISLHSGQSLLVLICLAAACEGRDEAGSSQSEVEPATVPAPAPAPGPATPPTAMPAADEDLLIVDLEATHENFAKKEAGKAADGLRSAASRLKTAGESAPEGARKALSDAAQKLEHLEAGVRSGAVTDIAVVDRHLAHANAAVAHDRYLRAMDSWAAKDGRAAGREIGRALDHAEAGAKRLGHTISGEAADFGNRVRDTSRKLADGAQMAEADVSADLKRLGHEIEKLGDRARSGL